jgi:transmembrane sensor
MTARDIEQRAAAWIVRRDQSDWMSADDAELRDWLAQDTAHKAAFWRLDHGWRAADRLVALHHDALPVSAPTQPTRWRYAAMAMAVCLVFALALAVMLDFGRDRLGVLTPLRFATAVGAQRDVTLADGSRIKLNTDSALVAQVDRTSRDVQLERGEVFFDIAHDAKHPFVIHAGDRRITVLGTRFSVRRDGATVRVAVVEGRVRVDDAGSAAGAAAIVTAGNVAVAHGASLLVVDRSAKVVDDSLSWRRGRLTFDQTMLRDAVTEFNRYNRQQIRIADDRAGRMRIGGSFEATNSAAFARLLHAAFGLDVRADGDIIIISS